MIPPIYAQNRPVQALRLKRLRADPLAVRPVRFGQAASPASSGVKRFFEDIRDILQHALIGLYLWAKALAHKLFSSWDMVFSSADKRLVLYRPKQSPLTNFYRVDPFFYRGAQPGILKNDRVDPEVLKNSLLYLRDRCGVRTVLNLRNPTDLRREFAMQPKDHIELERRALEALNAQAPPEKRMQYVSIPVESGAGVTPQQLEPILNILKSARRMPVFVHCKAGIDRTGIVSALYRALNYPKAGFAAFYEEMKHCGHDPNGLWQGYKQNLARHLQNHPAFSTACRPANSQTLTV